MPETRPGSPDSHLCGPGSLFGEAGTLPATSGSPFFGVGVSGQDILERERRPWRERIPMTGQDFRQLVAALGVQLTEARLNSARARGDCLPGQAASISVREKSFPTKRSG
jgi:hypothetical protein